MKTIVAIAGVFIIAGFGVLTFQQALLYRDTETLFLHNIKSNPGAAMPYAQVGSVYLRRGDLPLAESFTRDALKRDPESAVAWSNLGLLLQKQNHMAEAIQAYRRALEQRPRWYTIKNDLAWHLATTTDPELRQTTEALRLAREAVEATHGNLPEVLDTLSVALASSGDYQQAVKVSLQAAALARLQGKGELTRRLELQAEQFRNHVFKP